MHVCPLQNNTVKVCYTENVRHDSYFFIFISQMQFHDGFDIKKLKKMTLEYLDIRGLYVLLIEWEGRRGKYLARGQGVRTERSEICTS